MKQLQDANNTIKAQDQQIKQLQAGKLLQINLQSPLQDAVKIFAMSLCKKYQFLQRIIRNRLPRARKCYKKRSNEYDL